MSIDQIGLWVKDSRETGQVWRNKAVAKYKHLISFNHPSHRIGITDPETQDTQCHGVALLGSTAQVLQQSTFHNQKGQLCIKLGEASAVYNPRFRCALLTRLFYGGGARVGGQGRVWAREGLEGKGE